MALDPRACSIFLFVSLVAAGVGQTLWLRSSASRRFKHTLDGGRTFRGRRIFGDNKTWAGFVVMVPATGAAFLFARQLSSISPGMAEGLWALSPLAYGLLGCWTGLGFMLGELPNSFLKRQWRIGAGQPPHSPLARMLCFTVDQVDSIVGGLLALSVFVRVPLLSWLYIFLIGAIIHWLFNLTFMLLGMKTRAA